MGIQITEEMFLDFFSDAGDDTVIGFLHQFIPVIDAEDALAALIFGFLHDDVGCLFDILSQLILMNSYFIDSFLLMA